MFEFRISSIQAVHQAVCQAVFQAVLQAVFGQIGIYAATTTLQNTDCLKNTTKYHLSPRDIFQKQATRSYLVRARFCCCFDAEE